jgi:hypothetical protein
MRIDATSDEGGRGHAVGLYARFNDAEMPQADPPAWVSCGFIPAPAGVSTRRTPGDYDAIKNGPSAG